MQNKLIPYSLIIILIIPLFGFNFIIGFLGNILLLIVLIPLLIIGIGLLGFNSFKSSINICENCGSTIIGNNINCPYCNYDSQENEYSSSTDASNKIIEIKAEEID